MSPFLRLGNHRYVKEEFGASYPLCFSNATGVTALVTAAQGQIDKMITMPRGNVWDIFQATAQTLMPVPQSGGGLELALDQVNNEAVEYVPGGNDSANPFGFTAGTDPSWFFRLRFKTTTVAGTDQFAVGFRKQAGYQATPELAVDGLYTDFAYLANISGDVKILTDLNDSGTATVTDTLFNIANAEVCVFEVRVIGRRAYYYVNGVRLSLPIKYDGNGVALVGGIQNTLTPPAFTFDSGDFLIPSIISRQAAGLTTIIGYEYEVGPLAVVGKDTGVFDRSR
jgi:hypothetical protein